MSDLNIDFDRLDVDAVDTFVTENAKAMPEYAASSSQNCSCGTCSCTVDKSDNDQ